MTLEDRLLQIDQLQARRYQKLGENAQTIARQGIIRHLRACMRMDCEPDASAIREIIDDAMDGRSIYSSVDDDNAATPSSYHQYAERGRHRYNS